MEVVDTSEERRIGLMNRESLPQQAGMLFIFEEERVLSFWMKNTLIPLDMIFISKDLEIVSIQKNAQPCESDPCKLYGSVFPAKYVVEVNAGFSDRNGIKEGNKIEIMASS